MRKLAIIIFLLAPVGGIGQNKLDECEEVIKAIRKDGWRRDSLVIDGTKTYLRYVRGKDELKFYLKPDCDRDRLGDLACLEKCRVPKPKEVKVNQAQAKKPELPKLKPVRAPRTEDYLSGLTKACYIDVYKTSLGSFLGIASGKYAVFRNGIELFTCEMHKTDECLEQVKYGKEFWRCLRIETCIQNFRGDNDPQTRHCR